jgi:hypothetical protein
VDCDLDDFSPALAEFLMEWDANPATFATVKDWQKHLRPDQYLQMDGRYLEVAYNCAPTIDEHILAIQTEVQEGRYQWKNR